MKPESRHWKGNDAYDRNPIDPGPGRDGGGHGGIRQERGQNGDGAERENPHHPIISPGGVYPALFCSAGRLICRPGAVLQHPRYRDRPDRDIRQPGCKLRERSCTQAARHRERGVMPTSSIYHDVVIDNDEAAERLLEVLEQSEKWAEENAEPQGKSEG